MKNTYNNIRKVIIGQGDDHIFTRLSSFLRTLNNKIAKDPNKKQALMFIQIQRNKLILLEI